MEPVLCNTGVHRARATATCEAVRELCDQHGVVLIFDEVITGFRLHQAAPSRLGVTPDLTVLGKALAGGLPLACLAGTAEHMDLISRGEVAHAGTFNSNPVAIAAAAATLAELERDGGAAYEQLHATGRRLMEGCGARPPRPACRCWSTGPAPCSRRTSPTRPRSSTTAASPPPTRPRMTRLQAALLDRGVQRDRARPVVPLDGARRRRGRADPGRGARGARHAVSVEAEQGEYRGVEDRLAVVRRANLWRQRRLDDLARVADPAHHERNLAARPGTVVRVDSFLGTLNRDDPQAAGGPPERVGAGGYRFRSESPGHPRLQELRERHALDAIAGDGADLERSTRLRSWVKSLWEHRIPRRNPPWDGPLIIDRATRGVDTFICMHYSVALVHCCRALGLEARVVNLHRGISDRYEIGREASADPPVDEHVHGRGLVPRARALGHAGHRLRLPVRARGRGAGRVGPAPRPGP